MIGSRFVFSSPLLLLLVCLLRCSNVHANTSVPTATLSNGIVVPLVGLGCASGVRKDHVLSALEVGYRYLDTAQAYQWGYHEADVAAAIRESPHVTRREVFVTTKVHPENLGYEATKRAVQESLGQPGFEGYLDAVLIHKPRCWEGACNREPEGTWQESWKALEELYDQGKVKAIGICDINDTHLLDQLLAQRIQPHIIQNWLDPFHQETHMIQAIQSHGILFQGYSTLGTQWTHFRGLKDNPVQTNSLLLELAHRHNAPGPAQVVLQWATQKGISVLPASKDPTRQAQNLRATFEFQLSPHELHVIDKLDGMAPQPPAVSNVNDEIAITFHNPSEEMVNVLWVGQDGSEALMGQIEPGADLRFTSFHGHDFVFRWLDGEILQRYRLKRTNGPRQTVDVLDEEDEEL